MVETLIELKREGPTKLKREGPTPLIELDPNALKLKRRRGKNKKDVDSEHENSMAGGEAVWLAVRRWL